MASLRETENGSFVVCFRHEGKQYQRGLKTKELGAAQAAVGRVVDRLYKAATGDLKVPAGIEPADYIVWGDSAGKRQTHQTAVNSVEQLVEKYLDEQENRKADTTLCTEKLHLRHLKERLGAKAKLAPNRITPDDLDAVLAQREQEVEPITVVKERQTIKLLFDWAAKRPKISGVTVSPAADLRMPQSTCNRDNFRTLEEIEAVVERGGLSEDEIETYWESLYLTQGQIGEILGLAEERARHDFIHPMFAIAAYTGMRRGEIIKRLGWRDVDFSRKTITAWSKKQSRQERETSRNIPMHPELESILREYQRKRPKGQHVLCVADSLAPLTVWQAHDHFKRTLKGTRWERELPPDKKKVIIGFHTFRHSFASNLAIRGVDQRFIDRWMGHQTEAMRKRYQHLFSDAQADAMRSISFASGAENVPVTSART